MVASADKTLHSAGSRAPLDCPLPTPSHSLWRRTFQVCSSEARHPRLLKGGLGAWRGSDPSYRAPSRTLLATAPLAELLNPIPWGPRVSCRQPLSWDTSAAAAAPHLKSPKRTGRAHEFFVGRARVSGHRELGEGAKGAAAARQSPASEQPRLAGERASGPRGFSPSNPDPPGYP